jgi:excisionase family DNA binding protein
MGNESLLVHQMTGEQLINTIRQIVEETITRELAPIKRMMVAIEGATIERKEAAEILGVSVMTISNYVTCGKLNAVFVNGSSHIKYKLSEVLSLKK